MPDFFKGIFVGMEEEFLQSVQAGNATKVRALLELHPLLLQSRHQSGISPLLLASYNGHQEIVDLLLPWKPDLDLFEASALGKLARVMELIVESPERVNAISPDGFSPLGLAAFFGHPKIIAYLIEQGANVNAPSKNPMRVCPLHSAVAYRQSSVAYEIAEMLLAHGADPNVFQGGGWTPLHAAAVHGQLALAKLLLVHGADVNAVSENGKTPLQMAAHSENQKMIELLRRHGAEEKN